MVYVTYPRIDLDAYQDLLDWRIKKPKEDTDWSSLKSYLAENCRINPLMHPITKCWYSELHQGDNYALDVEHFRPKAMASPLNEKQVNEIEKLTGSPFYQLSSAGSYPWLKFDYRNYRIVSAVTNRAGAKHIYFPIVKDCQRLIMAELPWVKTEYCYFLDPTDKHDAYLLFVKPNGEIAPIAPKTELKQSDIDNLPNSWHNDAFNYIRALVTIKLYRLDHKIFNSGRKEIYDSVSEELGLLVICLNQNISIDNLIIEKITKKIINSILPSAQFSLAAKCAIQNYIPPAKTDSSVVRSINNITKRILETVNEQINEKHTDWNRP